MRFIPSKTFSGLMIAALSLPVGAAAQQVISARAGVVQYVEGTVTVGGELISPKAGQFPSVKENEVLKTEEGRAEILLTPGVFLRVGENTSVRMVSSQLTNTKVEFLTGSALVECDDMPKDNAVTILHSGAEISILKSGLYRFDGQPARVGVYGGEVKVVSADGKMMNLKNGHQATIEGTMAESKFDAKVEEDALYRWSSRRSDYVAMANVSSATTAYNSGSYGGGAAGGGDFFGGGYTGMGGGYMGMGMGMGMAGNMWAFNPFFGSYTYLPFDGMSMSPFGFPFWSPYSVWPYYNMYPSYYGYSPLMGGGGGGAYNGVGRTAYTAKQLGYTAGTRTASLGAAGLGRTGGFSGGRNVAGHISGAALSRGGFGGGSRGGSFGGGARGGGGFSGSAARGGGFSSGGGARGGGGAGGGGGHGH